MSAKIQAPFVLAEIRALRTSIFKTSPEIRHALEVADRVEKSYDLNDPKLFIPAGETFCAILDPLSNTILKGTLRRVGYEIFPQYVSILGIPAASVKSTMQIHNAADLVRLICDAYSRCVIGRDAGVLTAEISSSRASASVTDTTFMPCPLQMGVFLGAAKLTGMFRDSALVERRCRAKGDSACAYDFAL